MKQIEPFMSANGSERKRVRGKKPYGKRSDASRKNVAIVGIRGSFNAPLGRGTAKQGWQQLLSALFSWPLVAPCLGSHLRGAVGRGSRGAVQTGYAARNFT